MSYCPYYSKDCPEDSSCAAWKSFGCSAICKPGIPAVYDGSTNVFILRIFSSNAKASGDIMIIFCNATTGVIGSDDDLSKFTITLT